MTTAKSAPPLIESVEIPDDSLSAIQRRRENVFLILAGFFLCSMTLLNVIGITRFVQLGPMQLALGVLPYPLTFLCTDLVCELYGKRRANIMVSVGLLLNVFIIGAMTVCHMVPSVPGDAMPPWQVLNLAEVVGLPDGSTTGQRIELFSLLYATTTGAVFASMLAYIAAQYVDVQLFHFWKRVTNGKHLWIRNNFSTMTSQLIDSTVVILVTFGASILRGDMGVGAALRLIVGSYLFKFVVAALDTPIVYLCVWRLRRYLALESPATQRA